MTSEPPRLVVIEFPFSGASATVEPSARESAGVGVPGADALSTTSSFLAATGS
jgi:hypothetical protein